MSSLGALLPAWGYHLSSSLIPAGNYFLCLNAGLLIGLQAARVLMLRKGLAFAMVLASAVACGAYLLLALASPPAPAFWRGFGLLLIGGASGLLNTGVFHAISPLYRHDRAATVTLGGTLFGLGCLLTALLVAGTYYVYTVPSILIFLAAIPGLYAGIYARARFPKETLLHEPPLRQVVSDFKSLGAILFSLLLFFQFGNEWAIAGWLPLFLTRRLGISPSTSLFMLAFYWAALLIGRVVAQVLLKTISHGKLLMASVVFALLGCVILSSTMNRFGANTGILFIGCGFASIYPLVVEKIGHRFTYYHPGFYNGIFSFAITGGLLAPCVLGYLAQFFGIGVVVVMPMLGTCMVLLLLLLILLESKLSGEARIKAAIA